MDNRNMSRLQHDLPPLPASIVPAPDTCHIFQLYLAVEDDLTRDQQQIIHSHLEQCSVCTDERHALQQAHNLVASMESPVISDHIDQVLRNAIITRTDQPQTAMPARPRKSRLATGYRVALAAVAILLLILFSSTIGNYFLNQPAPFSLPGNLVWQNYIFSSTQTMTNNQRNNYQVKQYQDMANHYTRLEITMDDDFHVVIVSDEQKTLGLDMMRQVAEWDLTDLPPIDMSMLDLDRLRHNLREGQAIYEGTMNYQGQQVFRIREGNKTILLDSDYMPVNILERQTQGNEIPMYDTMRWLAPSQISPSFWDMSIPATFSMGNVPTKP